MKAAPGPASPRERASVIPERLRQEVTYQRKCKRFTSWLFFGSTYLTFTAGAVVTLLGGMGLAVGAGISAAVATILGTGEKALRFRDRWTLHRETRLALDQL